MNDIVNKARDYAFDKHNSTNHKYGSHDYTYHLIHVANIARKFIHLIPNEDSYAVIAACYCHDVIEDCRQSYNDVRNNTSIQVAEIVYAVTTEKGKTRAQRANDKYYKGIRNTPYATFVKLCDRLANIEYSKSNGSSMIRAYEKEHKHFKEMLFDEKYSEMFDCIEKLLYQ